MPRAVTCEPNAITQAPNPSLTRSYMRLGPSCKTQGLGPQAREHPHHLHSLPMSQGLCTLDLLVTVIDDPHGKSMEADISNLNEALDHPDIVIKQFGNLSNLLQR